MSSGRYCLLQSIPEPSKVHIDLPAWLGAIVTVQEAWVDNWSATAAGVICRGGDRRVLLYIALSCASALFPPFFSSSCWDSDGGALVSLYFPHPPAPSLCRQDRGELFGATVWAQAPLVCLAPVPPLYGLLGLLVLSSVACSHCGAKIPPTTIVLSRLVRYKGTHGDGRLYTSSPK